VPLVWSRATAEVIDLLGILPAFEAMDRPDRDSMRGGLGVAALKRGADLVLPEARSPGVIAVLRGALSPWLDDECGPEVTMPAVGPGGFVDYAAALGMESHARRWRVRSPTRLVRLDPALFAPGCPTSARLLYSLSRDLATTLRRTTGLAMHFETAWARQTRQPAPRMHAPRGERLPAHE
jgi:CRP-like cAMP-binding protein